MIKGQNKNKQKRSKRIILGLMLFLVTIIFVNINYHFGNENHIEQLPHITSKVNKDYLKNDPFVEYTREITPRYYYSSFLATLSNFIKLENIFYFLVIISNFLIILITFLIINEFTKSKLQSVISAIILTTFHFVELGKATTINDYYLTPQLLAMPLMLHAFYCSIKGNYKNIVLTSIISIFIQPTFTIISIIPITINIFLNKRINKKIFKILFLFFINLIVIYFAFLRFQTNIYGSFYTYILAWYRHPHHYIPSTFPTQDWRVFFIFISITVTSLIYLYVKQKREKIKLLLYPTLISISLLIIGYFFVETIQVKQIVELQLFRIVYFIKFIGVISILIFLSQNTTKFLSQKATNISLLCLLTSLIIINNPNPKLEKIFHPNKTLITTTDKNSIFKYIQENTHKNALFLTPPDFGEMRIGPQRAIVADWKSFPFNEADAIKWYYRVIDCYGKYNQSENYLKITDQKIITLKEEYKFKYIILYNETNTNLNIIYKDNHYSLVELI